MTTSAESISDPSQGSPPGSALHAFAAGLKAGITSTFIFVTVGTFIGIGALAHDFGFSLAWAVIGSVLLWAAPAQVILMTMMAGGAPLVEIALATALSGVRLLPMVISTVPMLRGPRTRGPHLVLAAHFIAVAMWVEAWRLLPGVPREQRVVYLNGMGTSFCTVAAVSTVAGFFLAALLPAVLTAALLMLTPLAFLMSVTANARALADRLALLLGLVLGPALAIYQVQFDLLWSGVIGGTLAYAAHRFWSARS